MSGLPGGAVTFMFTDMEGSTRLLKALRDQYPQVLAEHRRLVRAAIAGQAGHEVDTQGDAFFAAFAGAKQAVLCALEIHRTLASHDWPAGRPVRVRIGIHTGHAVPADGAYSGLAVNRAARIAAAAVGGQVLVSQATQTIIADEEEDPGFTLVDLGERKLKDLDRPVRLFEVAAPGLETRASPAARMRGCPYRGLLPFGESDAEVFYGRERLAAELAAKLAARAAGGGPVVVTGASGSGKSSLLRAGLLPILARGQQVPGSDRWPRIVMTPTKDPLTELASQLAAVGGPDALSVREGLAARPDQAHLAIRSAVLAAAARGHDRPPGSGDGAGRLVLIVDQFEQVFTLSPELGGEAAGQAFVTALCAAAATPAGPGQEPPALVVLAVRGDFWDRCAAVPELVGALQDGQFVVGPMTESELRVAITGPAEAAGLRIDPGLTETILGDLRVAGGDRSAGVLPLLSQAMALTWEHREGDRLTSRGYAQAGGVSHAVQSTADRAYDALPAEHQVIARDVLRRMTVASRDGGLARCPVTRHDLYTGLPDAARADIDAVLDAFAAERLIVLDDDSAQLSHDVLLRAWPRLRGWLEEDQASWIVHGQLADAAAAWQDSHDDPSFLYRGAQLATLRQAITRWSASPARSPALTGTQRAFLQASERAAARSSRRRRSAIAGLALLTILAVAASGVAFYQRAAAVNQRDQAIDNQVIAEALQYGTTDPTLAAQLTLAAYRLQPTQDIASRLVNTENIPLSAALSVGQAAAVLSVVFSPGGRIMATGNGDGTMRLFDVADPAHPRPLSQTSPSFGDPVDSVAFSPGGQVLASGAADGTLRLYDVADPAHPRPLSHTSTGSAAPGVDSLAYSPGGQVLATGGNDGTVRLWDVADPAHPRPLGRPLTGSGAPVNSVAFSPGGQVLASSAADGTVRLWDVADPAHPRPLGRPLTFSGGGSVNSVAFSPGGQVLASGSNDGTIRLIDVADPAHPRPLGQPLTSSGALVASVAFSPGGQVLASGDGDGTVRLWDVADPAHPRPLGQPLTGSAAVGAWVAFSPDGQEMASGGYDGIIRLWSLPQTVIIDGTTVVSAAFSPGGQVLASGDGDGTIRLFDVADPAHPRPLGQPLTAGAVAVDSVAFSPGGQVMASGDNDGMVRLWDVADPAHPRPLGQPLTFSGAAPVNSLAFSPGGQMLALGGGGTIQLWDVADPAHPRPLSQPSGSVSPVESVAFILGGRVLASGGGSGAVQLWDVADPVHPRPLGLTQTGTGTFAETLAISPSGPVVAMSDGLGMVQLWDVADPVHLRPLGQTGAAAAIGSVAFSPGGQELASGGGDGMVQLWDVADPAHPSPLSQPLIGSGTTAVTWVGFSPSGHVLADDDEGIIQLWNLNVQYAIKRICAAAGGLTPQQWTQYVPHLQYQSSCDHSSSSSSSSSPAPASPARSSAPASAPASVSASARAATDTDPCTTTISNQTVGNVLVPASKTCTLNNVTVHGNITVYGTLQLTTSADIVGNVVAEVLSVFIESGPATGVIDGNLTLNGPANYNIALDYVRGNMTVEHGSNLTINDWRISGSLFVLDNGPGEVISNNVVAGNINCIGDFSTPTNGGHPNQVHGHETGQCVGLH